MKKLPVLFLVLVLCAAVFAGCSASSAGTGPVWKSQKDPDTKRQPLACVWGSSATDVFAVGYGGTIIHYNGTAWSKMTSDTTIDLIGVWVVRRRMFSPSATLVRFCVTTARLEQDDRGHNDDIGGVWGTSPSDVFALTNSGIVLHYDSTTWSSMTDSATDSFAGIWGSSPTGVFAVGEEGAILHYDGTDWNSVPDTTTDSFTGVWGSSASDVYAVGLYGTAMHFDGSAWSSLTGVASSNIYFFGVWGSSPSDVYIVGSEGTIMHYDGNTWRGMASGTSGAIGSIWGSSPTNIFAVGNNGLILHYSQP